ncbi:MAG: hypothetical protein EAZ08_01075 [Cytophagales bacterium]|nr:MAG: hypothetical protein EAZ08_01075 [Cytophagales bacterium]
MENLLIMPKNSEEFSFLQELLKKLNIATQVVSPEVWEVPTTAELLQISVPSLNEVWENEDSEVWHSYLTETEKANV